MTSYSSIFAVLFSFKNIYKTIKFFLNFPDNSGMNGLTAYQVQQEILNA